jgi:hypothetical protein
MYAKTAVIEKLTADDVVVKKETSALKRYFNKAVTFSIVRISFISKNISAEKELLDLTDADLLSSSIIINFAYEKRNWESYIYQSFVCSPFLKVADGGKHAILNSYIHNLNNFKCEIAIPQRILNFKVKGTYFCQQNRYTTVCANAAITMAINNTMPLPRTLIYPEDINIALGIDHLRKRHNNAVILIDNIVHVLNYFGYPAFKIEFNKFTEDYTEAMYNYLEGRCSSLFVFTGNNADLHVVPIIGHTHNPDLWTPEADCKYKINVSKNKYISSSAWMDNLIIHDDNFGMYINVPVTSLSSREGSENFGLIRAVYALFIMPKKVSTDGAYAEIASRYVFEYLMKLIMSETPAIKEAQIIRDNIWIKRLSEMINNPTTIGQLVHRTFLAKKGEIKNYLLAEDYQGKKLNSNEVETVVQTLPELFWLTEITFPDLLTTNKNKLIEIYFKADVIVEEGESTEAGDAIFQNWIVARFPNVIFLNTSVGLQALLPDTVSHAPLFTHANSHIPLAW